MKTRKLSKILLLSVLASSSGPAWAANVYLPSNPTANSGANSVAPVGLLTLTGPQDFITFTGPASVPAGFFFGREDVTPNIINGVSQGGAVTGETGLAGGFYSFGKASSPSHYAIGINEATNFSDLRIYFKFTNDTGASLNRLLVNYTMEEWRDGKRVNQLGLKYSPVLTDFDLYSEVPPTPTVGPRQLVTTNPGTTQIDGTTYKQDVSALVAFPAALANGSTGYLRWGVSAVSGSGSRDALGITNLDVQVLGNGTGDNEWTGNGMDDAWSNDSNWDHAWSDYENAYFNTASTVVDMTSDETATDLVFNAPTTINDPGAANLLTLDGLINVVDSGELATVSVPLQTTYGIIKTGNGILTLGAVSPSTNDVTVVQGTLKLGINNALNAANHMNLSTTFDLTGFNVTLAGINGAEAAVINLGNSGSSVLTLDIPTGEVGSFKGQVTGTSVTTTLLKKGPGNQRLRSQSSPFAGKIQVDAGRLELTQNADLANLADALLTGITGVGLVDDVHGDLFLTNDSTVDKTVTLGSALGTVPTIDVKGGSISAESDATANSITLANNILFDTVDATPGTPLPAHNNIDSGSKNLGTVPTDFILSGVLSGGGLRKTGKGDLTITNASNSHEYNEIRNGKLTLAPGARFGGATGVEGKLYIKDEANTRTFVFSDNLTVTWLEASAPAAPAANTGFLAIPSTKTLTVNQTAVLDTNDEDGDLDTAEELKPSYDIALTGSGNFAKNGNGTLKFTNNAKALTGSVTVNKGVLQVSKNGIISGTGVTVNPTGQLRLSTGAATLGALADATYTFGGNIVLKSTQREVSGVITSSGFGHLGGLRFDPESGIQYALLTNNIVISDDADIHVNGLDKVLFLSGAITDTGAGFDLSRTGGGRVVIETDSTFDNTLTLVNGATTIDLGSGESFDAASVIVQTGAEIGAESGNLGSFAGNVAVNAGGRLASGEIVSAGVGTGNFLPVGPLKVGGTLTVAGTSGADVTVVAVSLGTSITVGGNVALPGNLKVDLNSSGAVNTTYDLVVSTSGAVTVNGGTATVTLSGAQVQNLPTGATQVQLSVVGNKIQIRPIP